MVNLPERPDLSDLPQTVADYIEALEAALTAVDTSDSRASRSVSLEPSEPPTSINVVTITQAGLAKRTPRHLYARQRRGGMGVFGLDVGDNDAPRFFLLADADAHLTMVTDQGRAFRVAVADVAEADVAGRGKPLIERFPLRDDEQLALVVADPLPNQPNMYLALATVRGQVRRIGSQYLGKNLQPGTVLYNVAEGGAPAASCWTSGNEDLFIVTRTGQAIRFSERQVPVRGCLGMRVDPQDEVIGLAAAPEDGGVFLLSDEGKGTIRLFGGFTANKSPGGGGKIAMKADRLVGGQAAQPGDDVLAISRLGKVIRFQADEVPPKEGVVQGVNCMALRADECVALAISPGS